MGIKAVLYGRTSAPDQNIGRQVRALHEHCAENMEIVAERFDQGVSGFLSFRERPQGAALLQDLSQGSVDVVLADSVDRWARDPDTALAAAVAVTRRGAALCFLKEGLLVTADHGGKELARYAEKAREEYGSRRQRCLAGIGRGKRERRWLGGAVPFGYRLDSRNHIVPDLRRDRASALSPANVIRAIQLLAAAGLSSPQLSRIFSHFGLSARRIRRLTAKRLGADEATWQRIQKAKTINSKRGKPLIAAPWLFLRDLVRRLHGAAHAVLALLVRYLRWRPAALPCVLGLITIHLAQRPTDHTLHPSRGWGPALPTQLAASMQLGGRPEHFGRRVHYHFARHCGISLRDGTDGLGSEPAVNSRPSIGTGHPFVSPGQRRALQGEDLRLPDANWDYLAPPRGQGLLDRGLTIRSWERHIPAARREPTRQRHPERGQNEE